MVSSPPRGQVSWFFAQSWASLPGFEKFWTRLPGPLNLHRARLPGSSNLRVRLPGFAKLWTRLPGKRNVRTRLPRPQFCKSGPGYLVDQITWSRPKVGQITWSRPAGPREMAFARVLAAFSPCNDAPSRRARQGRTRCRLDRPSSGAGALSRPGLSAVQTPCLNASLVQARGRGGPTYRCTPQYAKAFRCSADRSRFVRSSL